MQGLLEIGRRRAVFNKGTVLPGRDPDYWRADGHGAPICWGNYGDRKSPYGWEIDHFPIPRALGGSDELHNLRPLRCSTNAGLGGRLSGLLGR